MQFTLDLQLDVDRSAGDFDEIAYRWLDEMSRAVVPDHRTEIADLPARVAKANEPYGPLGEPNALFGIVKTTRGLSSGRLKSAQRNASTAGMRWLRQELADLPDSAWLWFGRLDERGHRSGSLANLQVDRMEESAEWLRLSAYIPELTFIDPIDGAEQQQRYLDAARSLADHWNPGFGQAAYALHYGSTAYEACLRNIDNPVPQEWWDARYTLNHCREFLRGYSWLTVVPQELAARLGGPSGLAATGAFAEVRPLSKGGVWLLATHDYRDFDDAALRSIFNVVAPILRPGRLTNWPRHPNEPPLRVIFEDS
jgi:hypothetical protein